MIKKILKGVGAFILLWVILLGFLISIGSL